MEAQNLMGKTRDELEDIIKDMRTRMRKQEEYKRQPDDDNPEDRESKRMDTTEPDGENRDSKRPSIVEGIHKVNQAGINRKRSVRTEGEWAHLEKTQPRKIQSTDDNRITRGTKEGNVGPYKSHEP